MCKHVQEFTNFKFMAWCILMGLLVYNLHVTQITWCRCVANSMPCTTITTIQMQNACHPGGSPMHSCDIFIPTLAPGNR